MSAIQENPELVEAKRELQNIIDRQQEYGLSQSEKISLLAREKEQRAWITELTKRLIKENRNQKSNLENAIGAEKKIAMTLYALGPELCIGVLSPLIVLLFGAGCGLKRDQDNNQDNTTETTERVIYVPIQANQVIETSGDNGTQNTIGQNNPGPGDANNRSLTPVQNIDRAQINPQWNPFT